MRLTRARLGPVLCGLVVGLTVFTALATPAAAQSVNRDLIDELNTQLLYVAIPLSLFVEVILLYAVIRFRDNESPRPTVEDPPLEVTWTAATAIILAFVGLGAFTVLGSPYLSPAPSPSGNVTAPDVAGIGPSAKQTPTGGGAQPPITVDVLAYQWGWQFSYGDANVTSKGVLVIPANRTVRFRIHSADVIHSLFMPELGIKKDAVPGRTTHAKTFVYRRGEYRLVCAEFCGAGHSKMRGTTVVVSGSRYRSWLDANEGRTNVTTAPGDATTSPGNATTTTAA